MLGGAGAEDFVAGSLSSCFTTSVGGSGSFFTSTAIPEHSIKEKLMDPLDILDIFTPLSIAPFILSFECRLSGIKFKISIYLQKSFTKVMR